jgi:hypothetical protein
MADVVDLNQRRKPSDPELVESCRVMLSEAQNGRMAGLVAVCMNDDGELDVVLHGPNNIEAIGLASWLHAEMLKLLQPE